MTQSWSMLIAFCLIAATAQLANARPAHRFDATTNSCRDFSKGQAEWDSSPWGIGGQLFKTVCKSCHTRDNNTGAKFLWEESKTSKAWNRVFFEKYPACAKNGSWQSITPEQLLSLNDYLYRFSANSQDAHDSA
ncbi:MAG: hypothetical protein OEV73_02715 [Desulfobulbaceae bacterium]|nr:hypothetical protein [Desulfobulbaceae bacterium]